MLARVLIRRVGRRLKRELRGEREYSSFMEKDEVTVDCNGVEVIGRTDLSGGGIGYLAGYSAVLLTIEGAVPCRRMFEFCAGPAYIGYGLLGAGFCKLLTLADVNSESVELARRTAQRNGIESLVEVYESDSLEQIPESEAWDLVVGNPPHFLPGKPPEQLPAGLDSTSILYFDPDWETHRKFYAKVKRFMSPGGYVVMLEDAAGSTVDDFAEMIDAGGGTLVAHPVEHDLRGEPTGNYYVVSRW